MTVSSALICRRRTCEEVGCGFRVGECNGPDSAPSAPGSDGQQLRPCSSNHRALSRALQGEVTTSSHPPTRTSVQVTIRPLNCENPMRQTHTRKSPLPLGTPGRAWAQSLLSPRLNRQATGPLRPLPLSTTVPVATTGLPKLVQSMHPNNDLRSLKKHAPARTDMHSLTTSACHPGSKEMPGVAPG